MYHLATDYRTWFNDTKSIYDINVQGTRCNNYRHETSEIEISIFTDVSCACINETRITDRYPRIPLTGLKMVQKHRYFDCSKAVRELSPVEVAMENAVNWFREHGYVQ